MLDPSLGSALAAALQPDATERRRGEEYLRLAAAEPGFCMRLLGLSSVDSQLPDSVRLLAATQLKNDAVRHWRRGNDAAHQEERAALRVALVARLSQPEPSERVGVQIALAVARIMRSEANTGEASVLEAFVQTLACATLPEHALLALLHTAKELASMRLPAQRRLAARVGHVMMRLIGPRWEATVRAVLRSEVVAATHAMLHATLLHTKLLRRLIALSSLERDDGRPEGMSSSPGMPPAWPLTSAASVAVEAAAAVQRAGGSVPPVCVFTLSKLGGALGKLLHAIYAAEPCAETLDAALTMLLVEAEVRRGLRRRVASDDATHANGHGAMTATHGALPSMGPAESLMELELREVHGSALAVQLAALVEKRGVHDEGWLAACTAAGRYAPLVRALVGLMGRPIDQLRRWGADPESFACEVLLPLDDDDDEAVDTVGLDGVGLNGSDETYVEDDGEPGGCVAHEVEDAEEAEIAVEDGVGGGGGGGSNGSDLGWSSGSASDILQRRAEATLLALLYAAPDEVAAALLSLLPSSPCTPGEPLDEQIYRDACYTALGIGACMLDGPSLLSYAQVLAAAQREAAAIVEARAANPTFAFGAALQARLCWLLSCWWAFGGSGDEVEDARHCSVSYGLLVSLLHSGTDVAVRLLAAHVLHALLPPAHSGDLRTFVPHTPLALTGLAATLAMCTADDAHSCALRTTRAILRRVPEAVHTTPMREAMVPVLNALWQRAESEQREMLQHALQLVHAATRTH